MKTKTINSVICKKFDDFLSSISDNDVRDLVESNTIITGGCIASMLLKEQVNDYDLYFRNKETALAVANYYVSIFNANVQAKSDVKPVAIYVEEDGERIKIVIKSAGIASDVSKDVTYKYFEGQPKGEGADYVNSVAQTLDETDGNIDDHSVEKYKPLFLSANAISLSSKIQIIIRFYGEHDEIHGNYDFIHCTNYWDSKDRKVQLNLAAMESLMSKELVYIGSRYPVCSIVRTRKFINRGWTINAGQYLKMCFQVSLLDLTDIPTLEEQLTGVDVAYFAELINGLKSHKEKHEEFKLEYGYLASIIDKIF